MYKTTLFRAVIFVMAVILLSALYAYYKRHMAHTRKARVEGLVYTLPDSGRTFFNGEVTEFYTANYPDLFWFDDRGYLLSYTMRMIDRIRNSGAEGLSAGDYHLKEIELKLKALETTIGARRVNAVILLDMLLTDAFVRYTQHHYAGRVEADLNPGWQARISEISPMDSLKSIKGGAPFDSMLNSFMCKNKQYHLLRGLLTSWTGEDDSIRMEQKNKIILSMERLRWRPRTMPAKYIDVNIPEFELRLIEADSCVLEMKIIVGTSELPTPLFNAKMSYFVLNPWWEVPSSIAKKEMLPLIKKDRKYLTRNHIKIYTASKPGREISAFSINWRRMKPENFNYRLRQQPGPWNALGRIKFIFPNPYNVYFHDTPQQELFSETTRTFSHGCIRIEKPVDLAARLLQKDTTFILQKLESGEEEIIYQAGLPMVYISYHTAWMDAAGNVCFADDIYGYDKILWDWINANVSGS